VEDIPIRDIPADIENWSENFALAGYDPKTNIGVFWHIGRWRKDLDLWREMVTLALPDGSIVAHRGIGDAHAGPQGPGSALSGMKVGEEHRRQQWHFRGGARRVQSETLLQGQLRAGPGVPVKCALDFTSDLPIWSLGGGGNSSFAGHGHDEQIGRLTGEIRVGDEVFQFDAEVNRDHSRGPRLVGALTRHLWFQGIFENGLRFLAYTAHEGEAVEPTFSEASVIVDGQLHPAKLTVEGRLPDEDPADHLDKPIAFSLVYDGGELRGEIVGYPHTMCFQFTSPWDSYVGAWPKEGEVCNRFLAEQSVIYRLEDGTAGHGHLERTVPGRVLADEELIRLAQPA